MSRRKLKMTAHERVLRALRREHEGITDYLEETEPYLAEHPEDKVIAGQVKYFKKRLTELASIIAQHDNRETVPRD